MEGADSSHVYMTEKVLGMLDCIDEPICDGSDDDLGMIDSDCCSDEER